MNESITEWQIFSNFVFAAIESAFLLFFYSVIFGSALLMLGALIARILKTLRLVEIVKKPFLKSATLFKFIQSLVKNYGPFRGHRNEYLLLPIVLAPILMPVSYFILKETTIAESGPGSGVGSVIGMICALIGFVIVVVKEDKI